MSEYSERISLVQHREEKIQMRGRLASLQKRSDQLDSAIQFDLIELRTKTNPLGFETVLQMPFDLAQEIMTRIVENWHEYRKIKSQIDSLREALGEDQ